MIWLVTGGSGCGKSTWAEKLVQSLPGEKRIYIATMQVYDQESEKRVQRHRAQRANLGFRTVECEKTCLLRKLTRKVLSCWRIWLT